MLEKVLANPQIINMVASAVGSSSTEEEIGTPPPAKEPSADAALSRALPEGFAEKLPEIMSVLSPMLSGSKTGSGAQQLREDRRACLLRALKPYLSKERCEAIDYMLAIGRISELLKTIN